MELATDELKILVHRAGLNQLEKVLLLLLGNGNKPKKPKAMRSLALEVGLGAARKWNLSDILGRSGGCAILLPAGWEISPKGLAHLEAKDLIGSSVAAQPAKDLRSLLPKIADLQTRAFVAEAISCYENKNFRAAAVLSWVGAVATLYEYVLAHKLADFNVEWKKRFPKKKAMATFDDLAELKEFEFLEILHSISILGKTRKHELEARLKFRNGCGHPNTLTVGPLTVAAHLESLINNVYTRF